MKRRREHQSSLIKSCGWLFSYETESEIWDSLSLAVYIAHEFLAILNSKTHGLLGGVFFGEIRFVLSNFLSSEDLSISYES